MKTTILIMQLFLGITTFSQGNLQFNQTKLIEVTGNLVPNTTGGTLSVYTLVVPPGKTFKITSASITIFRPTSATPFTASNYTALLKVGNTTLSYFYPTGAGQWDQSKFPIWIPAGSYNMKIDYDCSNWTGLRADGHISGIEFNIVP